MIFNFKNPDGVFMHQVAKAFTFDPTVATGSVLSQLRKEGCTPGSVVCVYGNYTMAQLEEMADSDTPPAVMGEVTYYDHNIMNEEG